MPKFVNIKSKKIDFIKQYWLALVAIVYLHTIAVQGLYAQNLTQNNYYSIGYEQTVGSIIKHSSSFIPKVKGISSLNEIVYTSSFLKPKAWKRYHNFPEFKLSLLYAHYANRSIFGDSFNALVGLNYTKQSSKWKRNFSYQFGINYSTKPYNIVANPNNNVIGSNINLALKLAYGFEYYLKPNLSAGLNAVIMHHSNGSAQTPNLGINVAGLGFNVKWYQNKKPIVQNEIFNTELSKPHQFGIALAFARHERIKPYNGPKYAVYGLQVFGQKRLSRLWQFNYGVNLNYRTAVVQSFRNFDLSKGELLKKVLRWYPYLGGELLYGNFGLTGSIGFYPVSKNTISTRIPTTLGANYYFKNLDKKPKNNIRLSANLKTHFATAEYIIFLVGYIF